MSIYSEYDRSFFVHHGVKGMKWGVIRKKFQERKDKRLKMKENVNNFNGKQNNKVSREQLKEYRGNIEKKINSKLDIKTSKLKEKNNDSVKKNGKTALDKVFKVSYYLYTPLPLLISDFIKKKNGNTNKDNKLVGAYRAANTPLPLLLAESARKKKKGVD